MTSETWDEKYDAKTVSAKITQAEFSLLKEYCEKKSIKVSKFIKDLIINEINDPIPLNIAGKNIFQYNKNADEFEWKILLDDGKRVEVSKFKNETFSQMLESMNSANEEREVYLKKSKKDSVSIPSNIVREKK